MFALTMNTFSPQTLQLLEQAFHPGEMPHLAVRTTHELEILGIDSRTLSRLSQNNRVLALARGVYVLTNHWNSWDRKTRCLAKHYAATKIHTRCFLSHASAALWWGCPELKLPDKVHLSAVAEARSRQTYIKIHKNRVLDAEQVQLLHGVLVTSPLQTAFDCASTLPPLNAICIADSFLHQGLCNASELEQFLLTSTSPGKQRRQVIAAVMSSAAESPAESIARFYLYQWKLPHPQEQKELRVGGRLYRPDFVWEDYRLILEVDGEIKYSGTFGDPQQVIRDELRRQRELERAGWRVVRVRWNELMNSPETLRAQLVQEMARKR